MYEAAWQHVTGGRSLYRSKRGVLAFLEDVAATAWVTWCEVRSPEGDMLLEYEDSEREGRGL